VKRARGLTSLKGSILVDYVNCSFGSSNHFRINEKYVVGLSADLGTPRITCMLILCLNIAIDIRQHVRVQIARLTPLKHQAATIISADLSAELRSVQVDTQPHKTTSQHCGYRFVDGTRALYYFSRAATESQLH
jgi:hypothetical protein